MFGIVKVKTIVKLMLLFLSIQSITGQEMKQEVRRNKMVGGYRPIERDNEQVITAAKLVVNNLKSGAGPLDQYSFEFPKGDSYRVDVKVLSASSQVVAGVNFKLRLGIYVGVTCIGGLQTVVYRDLQGHFSVSSYGNEISCSHVETALKAPNEDEE